MHVSTGRVDLLKTDWLFITPYLKNKQLAAINQVAEQFAENLRREPRLLISQAQKNPHVIDTRYFLKQLKQKSPAIAECWKQLTAMKLGVQPDVLDANPGFQAFAEKYYLERYLMEYENKLIVDSATKQIKIKHNGQHVVWNASLVPSKITNSTKMPQQSWVYGPNGVQNEDMYRWDTLKPFKIESPPSWGNRYVFEFCACCTGSPRKTGDHSWLRLKTPKGEIYSVGLYRPEKGGQNGNFDSPLRIKQGYLMQPDVSEFWPLPIQTIAGEITEEQFLKMKRTIEEDKKQDRQVFQLLQANCVLYVKKIASIAGFDIPTKSSLVRLGTLKKLEPVMHVLSYMLPYVIVKICSLVATLFYNLLALGLGAWKVDAAVIAKNGSKAKPHLETFGDLFSPSKASLHHPNTLGHRTRLWVERWRAELKARLIAENAPRKQIDAVCFQLPAKTSTLTEEP